MTAEQLKYDHLHLSEWKWNEETETLDVICDYNFAPKYLPPNVIHGMELSFTKEQIN